MSDLERKVAELEQRVAALEEMFKPFKDEEGNEWIPRITSFMRCEIENGT